MGLDRRPEEAPRNDLDGLTLAQLIPRLSPQFQEPTHLEPLTSVLDRAPRGGLRVVVACPVQHGKTTCVLHAVPKWLRKDPTLKVLYATYGARYSEKQSRTMRRLAMDAGVRISADHNRIEEWHTEQGGYLFATSVDGVGTGYGADIVVIDDPYKNREDAESAEYREKVENWFRDVIITRLAPGASIFIIASRWHEEDLSGVMLREGYQHVHLKAIDDYGRPLAPNLGRDLAFLEEARKAVKEYGWWSLFQGEPRPRGGSVFREPQTYIVVPDVALRIAIGCDAQYVEGHNNDEAVACVLAEEIMMPPANTNQTPATRGPARVVAISPRIAALARAKLEALKEIRSKWNNGSGLKKYVIEVRRSDEGIIGAENMFRAVRDDYPNVPMGSYVAGPEKGVLQLFALRGLHIQAMPAKWNKLVRAIPTSDEWNDGEILVPKSAPWLPVFKRVITRFTGTPNDTSDDDVDALVSARDLLRSVSVQLPGGKFLTGRRCM
jgi:predicted phage terminase large subunit-like protein